MDIPLDDRFHPPKKKTKIAAEKSRGVGDNDFLLMDLSFFEGQTINHWKFHECSCYGYIFETRQLQELWEQLKCTNTSPKTNGWRAPKWWFGKHNPLKQW